MVAGTSGTAGRGGTGVGGSVGAGGSTGSGGSSTGNGCTPPAAYANLFVTLSGHTQAESDAKVAAAWSKLFTPSGSGTIYFNGPGSDESYVKDIYNNDVRTEGMSYGMMIAVQLDHQTEFDRLWTWVKNHMATGCRPGCTGADRLALFDLGLEVVHRWSAGRRRVLCDRPHLCRTSAGATRPGSTTTRPRPSGCST